jgi:Cytochrome P460
MITTVKAALLVAAGLLSFTGLQQYGGKTAANGKTASATSAGQNSGKDYEPEFTSEGELKFPENYRQWVYLTTGFDMSYNPAMRMGHDMFDNVFVNPAAYRAFLATGTWPDHTVFVLEARGTRNKGSINQQGSYQDTEVMGLEVHIKDEARFGKDGGAKWGFFSFDDGKTSKQIPTTADCYSCHAAHAAVDTTFVQFYPTMLPIAQAKGTLSAEYLKDIAAQK